MCANYLPPEEMSLAEVFQIRRHHAPLALGTEKAATAPHGWLSQPPSPTPSHYKGLRLADGT